MKKISIVLAVIVTLTLFAGCASSGGSSGGSAAKSSSGGGDVAAPFIVDLSKLGGTLDTSKLTAAEKKNAFSDSKQIIEGGKVVGIRNVTAFKGNYDNLLILLPAEALPADMSKYTRFTITGKHYNAKGEPVGNGYGNGMVSVVYQLSGDIRNENGPNVPFKQFNLGMETVSTDRGVKLTFKQKPEAVLLQNSSPSIAFMDLTGLIFHNGNYISEQ